MLRINAYESTYINYNKSSIPAAILSYSWKQFQIENHILLRLHASEMGIQHNVYMHLPLRWLLKLIWGGILPSPVNILTTQHQHQSFCLILLQHYRRELLFSLLMLRYENINYINLYITTCAYKSLGARYIVFVQRVYIGIYKTMRNMLHSHVATYCKVVKMTLTLVSVEIYFTRKYNNRPCLSYVICFVVALTLICNIVNIIELRIDIFLIRWAFTRPLGLKALFFL